MNFTVWLENRNCEFCGRFVGLIYHFGDTFDKNNCSHSLSSIWTLNHLNFFPLILSIDYWEYFLLFTPVLLILQWKNTSQLYEVIFDRWVFDESIFFLSDWIDHMIQFHCEFQLLPSEINLNHLHVKRLTDQIKLQMTHIFNELSRLSVPYQWSGFHFVSFQSDKRRHFFMRNLIYYCEWNGFDFFWFDFGTTVSHSFNGINLFGKMSRID